MKIRPLVAIGAFTSLLAPSLFAAASDSAASPATAAASPAAARPTTEGPFDTEGAVVAASDALFAGPDEPGGRDRDLAMLTGAASRWGQSYDVLWRAARAAWAIGDRLDDSRDAARLVELGRQARGWAEEAVRLRPDAIEGHFYRALAVSVYARGRGLFRSLFEGLGGRYESDMEFVIEKDAGWGHGAAFRALGRYWFLVPRPKKDLNRSERLLRRGLEIAPDWMRTHLYLGDTLAAQGRRDEAAQEYRYVLDHEPSPPQTNESETVRTGARRALEKLQRG